MSSSLIKLNCKNNKIKNIDNIDSLSCLFDLKWLNLNENPIQEEHNYLAYVKDKLPDLSSLDNDEDFEKFDKSCDTSVVLVNPLGNTGIEFNKKIDIDSSISKQNSTFNSSTYSQKLRPESSVSTKTDDFFNTPIAKDTEDTKTSLKESENAIQGLKSIISSKKFTNLINEGSRGSVGSREEFSTNKPLFEDDVSPIMKKELTSIIHNPILTQTRNIDINKYKIPKLESPKKKELKEVKPPVKLIIPTMIKREVSKVFFYI